MIEPNSSYPERQISFSWDIHYVCNYRCPYCWWHGRWQDLAKLNHYLLVEDWIRYWGNIYKRYGSVYIEVLGGEPFIYPNFKELIKELSKMHTLNITTNLSVNIEDFTKDLDASKVKIVPTFHPLFANIDNFIKKVRILIEKGSTHNISYLAYPPQIRTVDFYRKKFDNENIPFSVMTFWGDYNGIEYPQGYTEEEKFIIDGCLAKRSGEAFQISPKKDLKGKLCHAGHRYAVIQADGKVIRCRGSGLNEVIGSFFDENFKLLDGPLPCKAEFCKCNEWAFLIERQESDSSDLRTTEEISFCQSDIKNEYKDNLELFRKNKEKNIQETLEHKIVLESKPLRLGIILTDWCNLQCIMCPTIRHKDGFTLSASVLSKIEELLPYLENINWQGGEFFKFRHVKEMFLSLKNYSNIQNEIITNGLLLDEEWIKLLLELNARISFSIDSPIKETYEYIRRGAKYDELISRLKLIIELECKYNKKLRRNITVVVMKSNYRHLAEFIKFIKEYQFDSISFNPVMFIDTEENIFKDPTPVVLKYLDETMNYMTDEFAEWNNNFSFIWNLPSIHDKDNPQRDKPCKDNSVELFCNLPWKSIWISADRAGDVTSDCWCNVPAGNIFQNTLLEIWNNKMMQEHRKRIIANDISLCNKDCINGYSSVVSPKFY